MKAKFIISGILVLLIGIQFIPVETTNPAITNEPDWDSPRTEELAKRACFDCHSNETVWPWYSHVAPVSWIISSDVVEGREHFNISEYNPGESDADEAAEEVEAGRMPMSMYVLLHPEADFTPEEKEELVKGLTLTFGRKSNDYKKPQFSH